MSCIERSVAVYHTDAAVAGTTVTIPDPSSSGNIWGVVTVVNDTDQDIKVTYKTDSGYNGEFIVPKSVIGFTKALKAGAKFDNTTVKVASMAISDASGKITLNFGI